jgi:hypothetical protein
MVWGLAGSAITVAVLIGVSALPATSRKSIGHEIVEFRVPLGVKLASFWYRDWMYRHIVAEATRGLTGDLERVNALFEWVVRHIRTDMPKDWAVEDDHPLHVIIRGYGADWQVSDVFTILCTYAGYPAVMGRAKASSSTTRVMLAFVSLRGDWRVFDPYHRNRFVGEDGVPLSVAQLEAQPQLALRAEHQPVIAGVPYGDYFHDIRPVEHGAFLRPKRQMWWPRLWHEVGQLGRRVLGGAS